MSVEFSVLPIHHFTSLPWISKVLQIRLCHSDNRFLGVMATVLISAWSRMVLGTALATFSRSLNDKLMASLHKIWPAPHSPRHQSRSQASTYAHPSAYVQTFSPRPTPPHGHGSQTGKPPRPQPTL